MTDINPVTPDNHDSMYQDGIKLLEDALLIFAPLNTAHGKALAITLQGAILLGKMLFNVYKK